MGGAALVWRRLAQQSSRASGAARHGIRWYEVDFNWYGIWALTKLGLARQVYRVKLDELRRREEEAGDGMPAAARTEMVLSLVAVVLSDVAASQGEDATQSKDPTRGTARLAKMARTRVLSAISITPHR